MSKKIITDDDFEDLERPQGLFYFPDISNISNISCVLDTIDSLDWKSLSDSKNSRKVQHYGYLYDYKSGKTKTKTIPIPNEFYPLIDFLKKKCIENDLKENEFNQVIVNNYEPGQGISAHTDVKDYGGVIGCYTIGGGANISFTRENKKYDLYVKTNSLYIMSGESRYKWKHEMSSRKSDMVNGIKIKRNRRVSITFRFVD